MKIKMKPCHRKYFLSEHCMPPGERFHILMSGGSIEIKDTETDMFHFKLYDEGFFSPKYRYIQMMDDGSCKPIE